MTLTRWKRDDARNEEALRVMAALLDGLAENPRKALVWSRSSCAICGRTLTDPVSKEAGIGPECRGPAERFLRAAEAAMEQA